jgi:hypothetical protein
LGIFASNRWCDCHRFVGVKIAHAWCLVLGAWCLVLSAWCLVLGA